MNDAFRSYVNHVGTISRRSRLAVEADNYGETFRDTLSHTVKYARTTIEMLGGEVNHDALAGFATAMSLLGQLGLDLSDAGQQTGVASALTLLSHCLVELDKEVPV